MSEHPQPWRRNPLLRMSYSLYAPIYDLTVERAMRKARAASLSRLPLHEPHSVLIGGVGTGLDLPLLPAMHRYTALDFNPAMMARARARAAGLDIGFVLGDCMDLPFGAACFDDVVLHLIVAVVPDPQRCLAEAARVLKPGGKILLLDKFLHTGQHAPLRRLFNIVSRRFVTRMDVVFEELLRATPELEVACDDPALAGGWYRAVVLRKR